MSLCRPGGGSGFLGRREIFEGLGSLTTISYFKIGGKSANTAPQSAKFSPAARYNPRYPRYNPSATRLQVKSQVRRDNGLVRGL